MGRSDTATDGKFPGLDVPEGSGAADASVLLGSGTVNSFSLDDIHRQFNVGSAPGDGSCLFHSISMSAGNPHHHDDWNALRRRAADYWDGLDKGGAGRNQALDQLLNSIRNLVGSPEQRAQHLRGGAWGDEAEVAILSFLLGRRIDLYDLRDSASGSGVARQYTWGSDPANHVSRLDESTVAILRTGGTHYVPLFPKRNGE